MAPPKVDPLVRVLARVQVGDCWEHVTPRTNHRGATHVSVDGRSVPAHRVVYEGLVGPIPDGLVLDHLCRNPSCVNPDHLEPVTQQVNSQRAWKVVAARCRNGHLRAEHSYIDANGKRACRPCMSERSRAWRERQASQKE